MLSMCNYWTAFQSFLHDWLVCSELGIENGTSQVSYASTHSKESMAYVVHYSSLYFFTDRTNVKLSYSWSALCLANTSNYTCRCS
jgi:hypothetical protein